MKDETLRSIGFARAKFWIGIRNLGSNISLYLTLKKLGRGCIKILVEGCFLISQHKNCRILKGDKNICLLCIVIKQCHLVGKFRAEAIPPKFLCTLGQSELRGETLPPLGLNRNETAVKARNGEDADIKNAS
jgi:hypothetical protein